MGNVVLCNRPAIEGPWASGGLQSAWVGLYELILKISGMFVSQLTNTVIITY